MITNSSTIPIKGDIDKERFSKKPLLLQRLQFIEWPFLILFFMSLAESDIRCFWDIDKASPVRRGGGTLWVYRLDTSERLSPLLPID